MPTQPIERARVVITPSTATDVSAIATEATRACPSSTAGHTLRRDVRSITARIAMFAMLLPNRSPIARLGAPRTAALTSVTISGSEVAPAVSSAPTSSPPMPVRVAISSPDSARRTPAHTSTPAAAAKTSSHCHRARSTVANASRGGLDGFAAGVARS